uniref:DNA-directed DNA polymerase n=1 Tax=Globodera rostochiensis TaxID=31243 RepID=A0A914HPF4_GLORO
MAFLADDDLPPLLEGPFSPAMDDDTLLEEAPPLEAVLERLHHEEIVPAQSKAAARAQRKQPTVNKELDAEQFNGENWMCLTAAQASSGRFKALQDDDLPPILDGPFSPAMDDDTLLEEAPPLEAVLERLHHEEIVPAQPKAAVRAQRKQPTVNKELDAEQFNGENWMCLTAAQASSGRFKAFRFLGRFMLNFIWGSAYPEDVLKSLFAMTLAYAVQGAAGMNIVADHFIFLLSARHLDYEIALHFKKIDNTTTEAILTRFEMVDQSNKSKERPSICEESFVIDITAIDSGKKRHKLAGKGRPKEFSINYTIHQGATYDLTNNDNLCLFRAFEFLRMKFVLPQQRFSEYKRAPAKQLNDVHVLCRACNVDLAQPFYSVEEYGERIQAFYNQLHPGMFRLFCFETSGKMKPSWKSNAGDYQHELCVLFADDDDGGAGHYDAIKAIGKLFNAKGNYCFGCEMPYVQQARHNASCKWKCHNCQRVGNSFKGNCDNKNGTFFETCLACNKTFKSAECYEHHARITTRKVKSAKEAPTENAICKSSKKCIDCGVIYQTRLQDKQKGHQCGQKFCRVCLGFHAPRDCYIPYRPKVKKDKRLIFFDFECTTDFKPDPELARFKHQVNFCYAHVTCTRCIEKGIWDKELEKACAICGPLRFYSWAPFYYDNTDVDRAFRVDDPLAAFTKWLLHFESETLGLDANERRKRKRAPAKNNLLDEEADDVDSDDDDANWMIFGEKGEKPVSVTTYAYAHAGSRYDHVLVYGEMLRMGVCPNLVRQGNHLLEMRAPKKGGITATVFRDSYKLIPLKLAAFVKTFGLEIDGVENKKYFPHKYNKEEALDTLPPLEMYYPGGQFPEERKKLERWHRENFNTPFLLREVIADYCKTDVQILAHEVIKMRELFYNETRHDITDSVTIPSACMKFFVTLAHYDKQKIAIIPHLGYEKRGKQSSIARKYLKWRAEEEMRENGLTLRHVESPGGEYKFGSPEWLGASVIKETGELLARTIKIKDNNSLYPSRNMFTNYPVGHPTLLHFDKDVHWCKPADMKGDDGYPLEGIIKCFVVPPRHVHCGIPVLPLRMNKRTLFPLCRKCSELFPNGALDREYSCPHFEDADRGFSVTIPHIELAEALKVGYRVTRVYRAYSWPLASDWSGFLFHSYLEKFLKMKFEASGYPANCSEEGISEEEAAARKQAYINKAFSVCQVRLNPDNIKYNPGLRYVSKLCLNSLWGRFALRNRLTKTEIIDNHADLAKLLNDDKIDISSIDQLTEKFWMVCYKAKDEHVVEHDTSNVALALWTTSAARIHLLDSLCKVFGAANGPGRTDTRVLYMDTDSIFYEYETALGDPLPGGEQLGELTDEYPAHTIVEFICAGPKAYALWLRDNNTGEDQYKMKLRGITLDSDACQQINYAKMKEMVLEKWGAQDNFVSFNYPTKNFRITKKGDIFTVPLAKRFNPTVNKGVIRDHGLRVVPFGYTDWEYCQLNNPHCCECQVFVPDPEYNFDIADLAPESD